MVAASFLIFALLQCPPSADYVAGVDAQGWAVAPADLPAEPHGFEEVTLDLDLPAANYTQNKALNQHFPHAELDVGEVVIHQDGGVNLNGVEYNDDCHPAD